MLSELEVVLRLILSAIIGGAIGIEREASNRPAGFRTHILVSVGSTLIMLVSAYGMGESADPGRIAAQVVSGIGFLGAGAIMRSGANIKGLTTAATLWVVAGIGLAVGSGAYLAAFVTTLIVYISLVYLFKIENAVSHKKRLQYLNVQMDDKPGLLSKVLNQVAKSEANILTIHQSIPVNGIALLTISIEILPQTDSALSLIDLVEAMDGVHYVKIVSRE